MHRNEYVTTIELCEEIGLSRSTVDRLRQSGDLIPTHHFYRGRGSRSPMLWNVAAVLQTLRVRTAQL